MGESLGTTGAGGMCSVVGTTLRQEDYVKSPPPPPPYDGSMTCWCLAQVEHLKMV